MEQAENCSKCNSSKMIPVARIIDKDRGVHDLRVELDANPDAFFFRNIYRESMYARICGECGYTELFVVNPEDLYKFYQNIKS